MFSICYRSLGQPPPALEPPRRRSLVVRLLGRAFGGLVDRVLGLLLKRMSDRTFEGEGFIDFASRRCLLDYGGVGALIEGRDQRFGRTGQSVASLPVREIGADSPLWLFDLLYGVVRLAELGSEPVRGEPTRRFRAVTDLDRVSSAVPSSPALPDQASYEDLRALTLDIWLGADGYVRKVRFEDRTRLYDLELFEFETTQPVDRSRLPALRS